MSVTNPRTGRQIKLDGEVFYSILYNPTFQDALLANLLDEQIDTHPYLAAIAANQSRLRFKPFTGSRAATEALFEPTYPSFEPAYPSFAASLSTQPMSPKTYPSSVRAHPIPSRDAQPQRVLPVSPRDTQPQRASALADRRSPQRVVSPGASALADVRSPQRAVSAVGGNGAAITLKEQIRDAARSNKIVLVTSTAEELNAVWYRDIEKLPNSQVTILCQKTLDPASIAVPYDHIIQGTYKNLPNTDYRTIWVIGMSMIAAFASQILKDLAEMLPLLRRITLNYVFTAQLWGHGRPLNLEEFLQLISDMGMASIPFHYLMAGEETTLLLLKHPEVIRLTPAGLHAHRKKVLVVCSGPMGDFARQLREIGLATQMYADDGGVYPPAWIDSQTRWMDLIKPFVSKQSGVYLCPADLQRIAVTWDTNIFLSYGMNVFNFAGAETCFWYGVKAKRVTQPSGTIIFADCTPGIILLRRRRHVHQSGGVCGLSASETEFCGRLLRQSCRIQNPLHQGGMGGFKIAAVSKTMTITHRLKSIKPLKTPRICKTPKQ